MARDSRARMIDGAVRLLAQHGMSGTSFSEVLELTGAPRGSIYHHFPEGKDQLIGSAIDLAGSRALAMIDRWAEEPPEIVAERFLGMWRSLLVHAEFQAGCSVLAVTVATDSPELLERTAEVFRTWRTRLGELFERGGLTHREATGFAALLVASSEGAVVLSRAERSMEPFDLVCEQLLDQLRGMTTPTGSLRRPPALKPE